MTQQGVGRLRGGLSLVQEDADPHADEHGEQKGAERADQEILGELTVFELLEAGERLGGDDPPQDRKSTRLNSSHSQISYAVFCLKKKKKENYWISRK